MVDSDLIRPTSWATPGATALGLITAGARPRTEVRDAAVDVELAGRGREAVLESGRRREPRDPGRELMPRHRDGIE